MKTADEMFRELGYKRCEDTKVRGIEYVQKCGMTSYKITIIPIGEIARATMNGHYIEFSFNEIRAVAKLLEEMEEEHETD